MESEHRWVITQKLNWCHPSIFSSSMIHFNTRSQLSISSARWKIFFLRDRYYMVHTLCQNLHDILNISKRTFLIKQLNKTTSNQTQKTIYLYIMYYQIFNQIPFQTLGLYHHDQHDECNDNILHGHQSNAKGTWFLPSSFSCVHVLLGLNAVITFIPSHYGRWVT